MTFNGWKNYTTWLVILAITTNEPMRDYWKARANEIYLCFEARGAVAHREQLAASHLADEMQSDLTRSLIDVMPADGPIAMMAGDLMTAALGEVDWYEIAENQIEGILAPVS